MRKPSHSKQHFLARSLFIYLMSIAIITSVVYSIFWINEEITKYLSEAKRLKKSFIKSKNTEIKSIILEHKDYMTRLKYFPEEPIAGFMMRQIESLAQNSESKNPAESSGQLKQLVCDAILKLDIPVVVYDYQDRPVLTFDPFKDEQLIFPADLDNRILRKITNPGSPEGIIRLYGKTEFARDSVLDALAYYNDQALTGFRVVSCVTARQFDRVLRSVVLDSLSRWHSPHEEYIFVNTPSGYALLNQMKVKKPPEDILTSPDKLRERVFRSQLNTLSHPEGVYYTYFYTRIHTKDTVQKTAYFSYFPRWNWIIGTGYYHDVIETVLNEKKKELYAGLKTGLLFQFFFLCVVAIICFSLVRYFHRNFNRDLLMFAEFFDKSVNSTVTIDAGQLKFKEIELLALAANKMSANRHQAEMKMQESRAKLQAALDHMNDAVFITDVNGTFIDFNDAFVRFCRFKNKAECPVQFKEYHRYLEIRYSHDGEIRPPEKWAISSALRGETGINEEFYMTRKDTGESWVGSYNYAPIRDAGGTIVGAVATAHDITDRKKAEDEIRKLNEELENRVLIRTAQLATANKELESFSYSVSHDLRAPLRAINGFAQILVSRHRAGMTEEASRYLGYVVESSNKMEKLINDLLDYSRLARKKIDLQAVSLNDLLAGISVTFQQEMDSTGSQLILDNNLPDIICDATLLDQIFTNLVSNAITYRRPDIQLQIRIGYTIEDGYHILSVCDNGIGIHKDYWKKIFEVFQRLHTDEVYPGTGIGLASVKKGAELMGGSVWVESIPGEGSTFFIKLPYISL